MGGKTIYNLKNQKLIQGQDHFSKTCCCVFLVILVICGLIALTAFLVKNAKANSEGNQSNFDQTNYLDVGAANGDIFEIDERFGLRNEYTFTTHDGSGNRAIGLSKLTEFTATSIESPLSTSTMSPIPPRFLFVNTLDMSNSDNINTRSTSDSHRFTRTSEFDNVMKRTTENSIFNDAPVTPEDDIIDILSEWMSSVYGETKSSNDDDIQSSPNEPQFENCLKTINEQKCLSNSCKQSASRMLGLMNHAVDPCEDFYSYACGGFDINHFQELRQTDEILESMPDISTLDLEVPYNKLYHDFFISCTNYRNGNGLKEVSKFLYDLCQNHKNDLTDLIVDILMLHPQKSTSRLLPIFDVIMEVGVNKNLVPTISLPKLNSPLAENNEMDMYERACLNSIKLNAQNKNDKSLIQRSYKECLQNQTDYFKNLEKSIFLLQIFEHLTEFRKAQMIEKTLQFIEWNIINEFGSLTEEEFNSGKIETVGLKWLIDTYPQIDWSKLFNRLFGEEIAKHITEVRMMHSVYLVKIFDFYRVNTFEEIKTSLLSMMAHDMYMDFIEPQTTCDRNKYCQKIGTTLLPDIASKLYLEQFEPSDIFFAIEKFKIMFNQLIQTYNNSISANTWLSFDDKMKNLKKLSQLNLISDPYVSMTTFEKNYQKLYAEVNISPNDFVSNVFALKKVIRTRMYGTHGKSGESLEVIWNYLVWPISTATNRIIETNTIVLPTNVMRGITKRGRNELQRFEEFSTIGLFMASQISRFFEDNASNSNIFDNQNVVFPSSVEIHLSDPGYSKKANIFGIKMDEKDISASKRSRFVDDLSLRMTFDTYTTYITSDKSFTWTDDTISKLFYILVSQQFCTSKKSLTDVAILQDQYHGNQVYVVIYINTICGGMYFKTHVLANLNKLNNVQTALFGILTFSVVQYKPTAHYNFSDCYEKGGENSLTFREFKCSLESCRTKPDPTIYVITTLNELILE